jgi:hypothetical protein
LVNSIPMLPIAVTFVFIVGAFGNVAVTVNVSSTA